MRILYKFATKSRPHKLLKCLDNIQAMATHDNYHIAITADLDDQTMLNDEVNGRLKEYEKVSIHYGTSLSKVDAINRDMAFFQDWDILINMSDDMEFIMHGFDSWIVKDFQLHRNTDLFIHYPDQAAGQALCTMSIMGRDYYERFKYIYHPDYKSLFCDNEAQEVAKILGRYKFIKRRMFNHNHPAWGLAPVDALMTYTESFHHVDKETFERRKAKNFDL